MPHNNNHNLIKSLAKLPKKYIITLTSYGNRINQTLPIALKSLINQSVKPDMIVVYLSLWENKPKCWKELEELYPIEWRFTEDIKSYKKLIPALKEFPEDYLVVADDDLDYDEDFFKDLKEMSLNYPDEIICHRVYGICTISDTDKTITGYYKWIPPHRKHKINEKRIFPTTGGGIIYPPNSLSEEVFNFDNIMKCCPYQDDIWFWAMGRLKGTKFRRSDNCRNGNRFKVALAIDKGLYGTFNAPNLGGNDIAMKKILETYPEILKVIL